MSCSFLFLSVAGLHSSLTPLTNEICGWRLRTGGNSSLCSNAAFVRRCFLSYNSCNVRIWARSITLRCLPSRKASSCAWAPTAALELSASQQNGATRGQGHPGAMAPHEQLHPESVISPRASQTPCHCVPLRQKRSGTVRGSPELPLRPLRSAGLSRTPELQPGMAGKDSPGPSSRPVTARPSKSMTPAPQPDAEAELRLRGKMGEWETLSRAPEPEASFRSAFPETSRTIPEH